MIGVAAPCPFNTSCQALSYRTLHFHVAWWSPLILTFILKVMGSKTVLEVVVVDYVFNGVPTVGEVGVRCFVLYSTKAWSRGYVGTCLTPRGS